MNSVEKGERMTDKAIDMNEIGVDKQQLTSVCHLVWKRAKIHASKIEKK